MTYYYITDGRPLDRAVVCEVCETEKEARSSRSDYGKDAKVYKVPPQFLGI